MVQPLLKLLGMVGQQAGYHKLKHLDIQPKRSLNHQYRHMRLDSWQTGASGPSYLSPARQRDEFRSLCEEGELDTALNVLLRIDEQGTVPSVSMYSSLLKACLKKKALTQAKRVHAHIAKQGLEFIRFLGEYVVSTLVKCGGLDDAIQLFQRLPHRTAFSSTALISGYAARGEGKEALRIFDSMQQKGLEPNKYTFIGLLRACGGLSDLKEGKRIHAEILKFQCETDVFVGTCLVDMYGKCGSVLDAQKVFDGLSQRNVVTWTAMLTAYAQQGQSEKALLLYEQMLELTFSPDVRTYASVLQACGILAETDEDVVVDGQVIRVNALAKGKAIHSDVRRKGRHIDVFVASTLVSMYGKCGSIADAQNAFDMLSQRNVVSWTVMLAAYAQTGLAEKSLQLYEQMQQQGVSPDVWTFVGVLQACGLLAEKTEHGGSGEHSKLKLLETGKGIHAHILRKGKSDSAFLGSTLVTMYAKCGSIEDAQNCFDGDSQQNVVSWTALVTAYVEQGAPGKAFQLYEKMREEGVSPNDRTFVAALQACSMLAEKEDEVFVHGESTKVKSLDAGKALHAEVCKKGYELDVFVCSTLISMYGKCGSMLHAENVFSGMCQRNVVAWNAMLASYSQQGQAGKALQLYEQMQEDGVSPNDRTLVSALQACSMLAGNEEHAGDGLLIKAKYLERGKALHATAWSKGYSSDVFICNTLICMYGKCGSSMYSQKVFDGLSQRNVVSWNTLLLAYAEQGQAEEVLELYEQMRGEGLSADVRTFVTVLQACTTLAEMEAVENCTMVMSIERKGKLIHSDASRKGYDLNVFVGSTLISMYGKCGSILDAENVFDGLLERNVVSWNAMLAAYVEQGLHKKAFQLYGQMQVQNLTPNEVTYLLMLQACSNTGGLDMCRQIQNNMATTGSHFSPLLVTTLIHAYGKCATMVDAQNVFDTLLQPDVVAWNALIAGYSRQGDWSASLKCYEQMQLAGVKPNAVTFISVLSSCSHAGLVDKGVEYFESMTREFALTPEVDHYVCMADLLGRAGYFTEVEQMLSTLPMQPNLSMWLSLLGACRKHGKVLLAKRVFDCAVDVYPRHGAAYVLMSNIYADAGLWDCSNDVKEMEQKAGTLKKPAGQSWIQNKQEIHTFVVDDQKHLEQQQLYDLLGKVRLKLAQLTTCKQKSLLLACKPEGV